MSTRSSGGKRTPEYQAWRHMKDRCYNSNYYLYANYGGRGIIVCERWRNSFDNFLADMGPRPSELHSLNRKDNDWIYTAVNCEWATSEQQNQNRQPFKNNSTGLTGVTWLKHQRIYRARADRNGKTYELYSGSDFFEACCARKSFEAKSKGLNGGWDPVTRTETVL